MSVRKRYALRVILVIAWLVLALVVVGPVLAQDGNGTPTPGEAGSGDPQNLDDIAVRLMPLLVGAALIERGLEFLFNWVERAMLDVSHSLHNLTIRLTGLVQVDLRKAWDEIDELTNAILKREEHNVPAEAGNPDSSNPANWPLAKIETQLVQAQAALAQAQTVMDKAMSSPEYVSRKKIVAAWLSMSAGIVLALIGSLRLFEPLGVDVTNWFAGPFDLIDMLLAGILMGLGTDWVHQVIGLLIQGKGLLGRAGGSQLAPEQVQMLATLAVQEALEAQIDQLREQYGIDIPRPNSPPT